MDWGPIIAAGVNIAQDFLNQDDKERERAQSDEQFYASLADKERDRLAAGERADLTAQTQLQLGEMSAETARKRVLGDVLLQQGQGQESLGIEAFRAAANRPERFNTAANALAAILAR